MNYTETLEYIHRVSWTGSRPGLSRITELLGMLGNPQDSLRFIHVAGTNGKGSFCAMCDSVLRTAGYKTGLYTSPYIERFNERIAIEGSPISDAELSKITTYVRKFADKMADPPTEFELITAVAMVAFRRHACELVVLEVGMGGRLDATNIIKTPVISVITGISLDHTAILGDTVEKIAAEKAGIIKDGVPVLYGGTDRSVLGVIKSVADAHGSSFDAVDQNAVRILTADTDGTTFEYENRTYRINLLGLYQPHNAATVISAVKLLRKKLTISDEALLSGLENAVWPGRFEILSKTPTFIIDGSHNPEGISAAVASVKHYFGGKKVVLLTGVMKDKNHARIAEELSAIASEVYTLTPNNPRSLAADDYAAEFMRLGVKATPSDTIPEAVKSAVNAAKSTGNAVVALGSLYMYGDVKHALLK